MLIFYTGTTLDPLQREVATGKYNNFREELNFNREYSYLSLASSIGMSV